MTIDSNLPAPAHTNDIEADLKNLLDEVNNNLNNGLKKIVNNISKKMNEYDDTFNSLIELPVFKNYTEKLKLENVKLKSELLEYQQVIKNKNREFDALNNIIIKLKDEIVQLKAIKIDNMTEEHISLKIEEIVSDSSVEEKLLYTKIVDIDNTAEEEEVEEEVEKEVEEEAEEEVEEDAEKEVEEEAEEVEEEEVEEEAEEVEEEEEEEEEAEEVEEEEEEAEEAEEVEEEEEVYEIEINGVLYFTNDKENGEIYKIDADGDPGDIVGNFKNGKAKFL
jgi:hypothetical protein